MKKLFVYSFIWFLIFTGVGFGASQQTSSTDASVIVDRARKYLNDKTTYGGTQYNMWADTELLQWVNDGTMDIVTRTHCLEAVETEALVANQMAYALSDAFILIRAVIYDQGSGVEKGLLRGKLQDIGKLRRTNEPVYWDQSEDNVIVYPKPDADHSGTGHNIDVYTVTRPSAVASSDDVLVPACYDRALTLYVAAQGFYKDSQFTKAGRFMAEYLAELDRFRMDFVTGPEQSISQ